MSEMRAGVIGLGALGEPIARMLLAAGVGVAVYDVRTEPVTQIATAGRAAARAN